MPNSSAAVDLQPSTFSLSVMSSPLAGTWDLVDFVSRDPDGTVTTPFGRAVGRLMYDAHGHMAGQIMQPGRAVVGRGDDATARAALEGYIAYYGSYEISADAAVVTHRVTGSLSPAVVGTEQVRRMRLEGDRLVLEADFRTSRGTVVQTLTWRKVA
jgi:hypothetical protein